jgi:putative membrane protein
MPASTALDPQYRTPPAVIATIIGVSVVASLFLSWLVYYHQPVDVAGTHLRFLPALNAFLNALCTVFLLIGFRYIRAREITRHRNSMFGAFLVSSLFLVSYILNHAMHGDMLFPSGHPTARFIYLWILLLPHILLAVVALPLILITFFLSLTGRFPAHRKLARWTFPIWLYVSVSGVVVYAMLAAYKS